MQTRRLQALGETPSKTGPRSHLGTPLRWDASNLVIDTFWPENVALVLVIWFLMLELELVGVDRLVTHCRPLLGTSSLVPVISGAHRVSRNQLTTCSEIPLCVGSVTVRQRPETTASVWVSRGSGLSWSLVPGPRSASQFLRLLSVFTQL